VLLVIVIISAVMLQPNMALAVIMALGLRAFVIGGATPSRCSACGVFAALFLCSPYRALSRARLTSFVDPW
jgi:cell division protein FtsW (lipid II flippase)